MPKKDTKEGRFTREKIDRALFQQRLPAWQPVITPHFGVLCFVFCAAVCLPIGIVALSASRDVVEVVQRYDRWEQVKDDESNNPLGIHGNPVTRWFQYIVTKTMKAPIFMQYELDGFYQGHRLFAENRDLKQLEGKRVTGLGLCKPQRFPGDLNDTELGNAEEKVIGSFYAPCGLQAWSMFNDTIKIYRGMNCTLIGSNTTGTFPGPGCQKICETFLNDEDERVVFANNPNTQLCDERHIAVPADRDKIFKPPFSDPDREPGDQEYLSVSSSPPNNEYQAEIGHELPSQTDEDLMVWMRTAIRPKFRKLWRKFPTVTLEEGETLLFQIVDRFPNFQPVDSVGFYLPASDTAHDYNKELLFKKSIVFTTNSSLGARNQVYGWMFIITGVASIVLALVFVVLIFTWKNVEAKCEKMPA